MMNYTENYKIANPETDYFVSRKHSKLRKQKKRNFPACLAWPDRAGAGVV